MLKDIPIIDSELVKQVEWNNDPEDYDQQLYSLGTGLGKFIVLNPWLEEPHLHLYIDHIPDTNQCITWSYQGQWVAKMFNGYWTPEIGYQAAEIVKPKFTWRKNPDLDRLMAFEDDPFGDFEPQPWDSHYKLVWYMDPRFNPLPDRVWAMSCQPLGGTVEGVKDMGYLTPAVNVEFNEHLPDLGVDVDQCYPAFYELAHECALELDPIHTPDARMWVVKFTPAYRKPKEWMWVGTVSPEARVEYNPDLEGYNYELDYIIPWHDLAYEHVWMLDKECSGEFDIWAVRAKTVLNPIGIKTVGYTTPVVDITVNSALDHIQFDLSYTIPYYDRQYNHVWYLDQTQHDQDKIWAIRMSAVKHTQGEKEMGIITPLLPDKLDVVFISYQEANAESNWQRVLEKAPWAKRVDGVEGIFQAHQAAAELATTDMFYVVDGDAWLVDDWQFDFRPSIFDRDCTYIWHSCNPINELVYGYGGVKLFSKQALLDIGEWITLDLATTVLPKLKVINTVSNVTMFNTDEFSTWRSAFRETVKLCNAIKLNPEDQDSAARLNIWETKGITAPFGNYALAGVHAAKEFFNSETNIQKINDRNWLMSVFDLSKEKVAKPPGRYPYIKLAHSNPAHTDWFVVNWCLGNTCNFKCSYCPSALHDGTSGWPELDVIKNFIVKVKDTHWNKNIYFEFTGGEVTMYKHFTEVCQFCKELGIKVGMISNGSRTIRYWEENKEFFDHVCLSFHPEFADEQHFVNVVKLLHNDIRTHVNIMMSPEKFDFCYAVANKVKNLGNISMALQPLIHDFGDTLYDYNNFQKKIFEKQHDLITKHIKFDRSFDYYRGAMSKVNPDGTMQVSSAHRFISENGNDWSGWKCYAGVEQLIVDMDGSIHRGWCKVGGTIGHINDADLQLPADPVICNKTMCHCNFDIMCTKEQ